MSDSQRALKHPQAGAVVEHRRRILPAYRTFETIAECAERLGVAKITIRRRIAAGQLKAYRSGRLIRIRPADADAMFRPVAA